MEQDFLLRQGQAFIQSPVGEAIIALDHSLQVAPRDEDRAPVVTLHEVVHALEFEAGPRSRRKDCSYHRPTGGSLRQSDAGYSRSLCTEALCELNSS